MAACACGDCGCNANSKYHDCKVADQIFKQLSPDIVDKLGSVEEYDTLLSYRSFENGAITIEISIKPKEAPQTEHACHDRACEIPPKIEQKSSPNGCCKHKSTTDCDDNGNAPPPGKIFKSANKSSNHANLANLPNLPSSNLQLPQKNIQHFYELNHRDEEEMLIDVEELDDRKVMDTKKFDCGDCDKTFDYKSTLERHRKTVHNHEKPHECPENECHKKFGLKHHLDRHKKQVHGEDRPHECPEDNCGKKFKDKYNMQVHRRIHTGLKPFVCPSLGCGKSFNQKGSFNNHIKTHNDLHFLRDEKIGLTAVPVDGLDVSDSLSRFLSNGLNPVTGAGVSGYSVNANLPTMPVLKPELIIGDQSRFNDHRVGDHRVGDHRVGDHRVEEHRVGEHRVGEHRVGDHNDRFETDRSINDRLNSNNTIKSINDRLNSNNTINSANSLNSFQPSTQSGAIPPTHQNTLQNTLHSKPKPINPNMNSSNRLLQPNPHTKPNTNLKNTSRNLSTGSLSPKSGSTQMRSNSLSLLPSLPNRLPQQFFNSSNSSFLDTKPDSGILPNLDVNACGENCGCDDDTPCLINHMSGENCCT